MSCGKCFEESTASGGGHGISRSDAVAGGGGGLPRRDAGGYLRCINPGCSRRPRVKADAACKQCGSKLHCLGEEEKKKGNEHKNTHAHLQDSHLTTFPLDLLKQKDALTELDLSGNQLTELPAEIGQFRQLQVLNVSGNQLSELPKEIGELNNLHTLVLNDLNDLSHLPPEIIKLSNLRKIEWKNGQLKTIPSEILGMSQLTQLTLSGNQIKSTTGINNLRQLRALDLSENKIRRSHTLEIGQLAQLEKLVLSHNPMHGKLPEEICGLTNLRELRVSQARIFGIPDEIGQLKQLQELDISKNNVLELPKTISQLTKLKRFSAGSMTRLTEIPPELGQVHDLEMLDLSFNSLETIPSELGKLRNLQELNLDGNEIVQIPSEITQLPKLEYLNLGLNRIETLPEFNDNAFVSLRTLDLNHNYLSGLPNGFADLPQLETVSVDGNKFVDFPSELEGMSHLKQIHLANNEICVIPKSLGVTSSTLSFVDLSNNQIPLTASDKLEKMMGNAKVRFHGNPIKPDPTTGIQATTPKEARHFEAITKAIQTWDDQLDGKTLSSKTVSGILVNSLQNEKDKLAQIKRYKEDTPIFLHINKLIELYSDLDTLPTNR